MELNQSVYKDGIEVGKIGFISNESIFVLFHDETIINVRFHKYLKNGFLVTRSVLEQFDKTTQFTLKQL